MFLIFLLCRFKFQTAFAVTFDGHPVASLLGMCPVDHHDFVHLGDIVISHQMLSAINIESDRITIELKL